MHARFYITCLEYPNDLFVEANILKCHQVALSKDLCRLIVMCSGDLVEVVDDLGEIRMAGHNEHGLHCLALNTAIFWNR